MGAEMTKRERVERTLTCEETDRVPLYDLLRCDAAFAYFSGEEIPPLAEDEKTVKELDRIAGNAVGGFLDMTRAVGFGPVSSKETTDEFGFVRRQSPFEKTTWIAERPFCDEQGAASFLERWILWVQDRTKTIESNPRAHRDNFHRDFLEIQANLGDTVNLLTEHGLGLDDVRHMLGLELFTYVWADNPGLISEAFEAVTLWHIAECHAIADVALSPAVLTYGDIAYKHRLIHSPAFLRDEFFPRLKRLNDSWHEHGFKCLFHSDGYLMEVMDDLIETGIDGLNPIETLAGMNLKELRDKYGHTLFLAGGIDMSQLLSLGTPDEVREVCRQAIRDAYPGYFMGSTTESDNSCKIENLLAMYEVALEGVPAH